MEAFFLVLGWALTDSHLQASTSSKDRVDDERTVTITEPVNPHVPAVPPSTYIVPPSPMHPPDSPPQTPQQQIGTGNFKTASGSPASHPLTRER